MLRLVFGLGTRAVERVEDDYPQIIALDQPLVRPYSEIEDVMRFSQHNVDLLDAKEDMLRTLEVTNLLTEVDTKLDLIASRDHQAEQKMKELGKKGTNIWMLTFEKLLSQTDFPQIMQKILKILESRYQYPVDIEFTANFTKNDELKINLVQCRPLQTKGLTAHVTIPEKIKSEKILFKSYGYTMGGSISQPIRRIIYIDPATYVQMPLTQKYDVARLVGRLNKQIPDRETTPALLLGPGRWGTTMPSLGLSVNFAEINNVTVLAEVAYEGSNLMPELSFGTHFFRDLVESDIFYVAIFPQKQDVIFNKDWFEQMPNLLTKFLPDSNKYASVVRVYETNGEQLQIMCDILSQEVICFFT
jgi:hypothetical protein